MSIEELRAHADRKPTPDEMKAAFATLSRYQEPDGGRPFLATFDYPHDINGLLYQARGIIEATGKALQNVPDPLDGEFAALSLRSAAGILELVTMLESVRREGGAA